MKVGAIKFGGKLGGYEIINKPASEVPEEVVAAVKKTCDVNGYTYTIIWYLGAQVVNGINHCLVCKRCKDDVTEVVLVVINISSTGEASIRSISEQADLYGNLQDMFETAMTDVIGVKYKPIAYVGEQLVKGLNHFILCQATITRPGTEPYPVIVEINVFQDNVTLVGIERLGGLGYAFTW